MLIEQRFERRQIVVVEHQGGRSMAVRNPSNQLRRSNEPVVERKERMLAGYAHITAPGVGPGDLDGRGRGIGTVLGELHHAGARD